MWPCAGISHAVQVRGGGGLTAGVSWLRPATVTVLGNRKIVHRTNSQLRLPGRHDIPLYSLKCHHSRGRGQCWL